MAKLEQFGIRTGRGHYHEEAIYSLALLYNLVQADIAAYLRPYDLTPGKFNILLAVKHQNEGQGLPQVQISQRLIVTPSNMTKLLDKLEKDGLVTRSSKPGDRRVKWIRITHEGARLMDELWEGYNQRLQALIQVLPPEAQQQTAGLLRSWFERLN